MTVNDPPVDRRSRRKAETRAKLLDAARTVFARQGVDATRINEITEEADVGFGSFYNHFESKEAIVAVVVEDAARALGAAIDAATGDIDDPAEVVTVAHRTMLAAVREDPEFGWLLTRLETSHQLATSALGDYALRDIERGVERGRFSVTDSQVALAATGGALLGVARAMLQGNIGDQGAVEHAAGVLRWLGIAPDEAAEIAERSLPLSAAVTNRAHRSSAQAQHDRKTESPRARIARTRARRSPRRVMATHGPWRPTARADRRRSRDRDMSFVYHYFGSTTGILMAVMERGNVALLRRRLPSRRSPPRRARGAPRGS